MNVRLLAGLERQAAVQTGTGTNVSMDARRLVIVGASKTSMTINRQLQKCWTPRHTFADAESDHIETRFTLTIRH